jgi:ribosome-binding protein aMBF1 (putative translation factor)
MKKKTDDALSILKRKFYSDPERMAELEEARVNDGVARKILALREGVGLSQRELAELVGTTASVICRLEDADYEGHSLAMLNRIARALKQRLTISFEPISEGEDQPSYRRA